MLSKARKKANAKYDKKMRDLGLIKRFAADIKVEYYDTITNYCKDIEISKPELLRRICDKIQDGTLSDYLNIKNENLENE